MCALTITIILSRYEERFMTETGSTESAWKPDCGHEIKNNSFLVYAT